MGMDSLIMYYSLTGRSRYEANRLAKEFECEVYEVREQRHRSMANAFVFGPMQAKARRFVYIEPIAIDIDDFSRIIIVCPIWGGYPAPAFNNIVSELPPDKQVEIYLTSDSGKAKAKDETIMLVELQGVHVVHYEVIKTEDLKKRDKKHMKKVSAQHKLEKKAKAKGLAAAEPEKTEENSNEVS